MSAATPQRVRAYVTKRLGLRAYLRAPGDGRRWPVIPAEVLLWAQLIGYLLREGAFHAVEALVRSRARRQLGVARPFSDDALAYFTERLDPSSTRDALVTAVRQAKRNKAFDDVLFLGLVVDGTTVCHCTTAPCPLCHPVTDAHDQIVGYQHKLSLLSLVGGPLVLPLDVEPYGPGDSEQAASLRVLQRGVAALGRRFAQYVVGDGLYASAPFLHAAGDLALHTVVRLKANLPILLAAAEARFLAQPPTMTLEIDGDRVELWDADDFDPWDALRWPTVRVLRYRQHHRDGTIVDAYWLTDFPATRLSSPTLYRLAKSRWTIENQGFNDGKTRYGLDHIPHHHPNSLLLHWLLVALALTIERLYRLRYLHRGTHALSTPIQFLRRLRLSLGVSVPDTG